MNPTTAEWRGMLRDLLSHGQLVAPDSPGAEWRGRTNRELLAHTTTVPMSCPVVTCPGREMGYRFLAAEAAWILSGDNRVGTIKPYAPRIADLSDDGLFFGGAYGPPFRDQLSYVIRTLGRDPASRQAVVSIWRERPGESRDVPCTISLQFLIRDLPPANETFSSRLHVVASMRSSDAWMGWVYDVFNFSMMAAYVLLSLRAYAARPPKGIAVASDFRTVELGNLYLAAGSQHLYKIDWDNAAACAARTDQSHVVRPINLAEFETPDRLVDHLWQIAERRATGEREWLMELTR